MVGVHRGLLFESCTDESAEVQCEKHRRRNLADGDLADSEVERVARRTLETVAGSAAMGGWLWLEVRHKMIESSCLVLAL